ncbi:hypothetical protein M1O16_01965 [Dehalococcoidia bacterium]|nr:hypothetical protein [Dehalococcoidia bacterium]
MDLLIGLLPIVGTLADMGGISINHRRDTICPAGLDKMTGYLVLGILYAVIDFLESSSLELEKFSFSVTALLFSAEFGMEGGFHLFPVLFLGTERPAVIDGALFSIEDSNGMGCTSPGSMATALPSGEMVCVSCVTTNLR